MPARRIVPGSVEHRILQRLAAVDGPVASTDVLAAARADAVTVRRMLGELVADGRIVRTGRTRATTYALPRRRGHRRRVDQR